MRSARIEYPSAWVYIAYPEGVARLVATVLQHSESNSLNKSELAERADLSRATIHEHISKLVEANVICQNDSENITTYELNIETTVNKAVKKLAAAIRAKRESNEELSSNWLYLTKNKGPVMMVDALLDAGERELNKSQWSDFAGLERKTIDEYIDKLLDLSIAEKIEYEGQTRYKFYSESDTSKRLLELETAVQSSLVNNAESPVNENNRSQKISDHDTSESEVQICDHTGEEIKPGTGVMFVRKDGTILHFIDSEAEKDYFLNHGISRGTSQVQPSNDTSAAEADES